MSDPAIGLTTPLQTRSSFGIPLETTLAAMIGANTAAVAAALGVPQTPVSHTALAGGFAKHALIAGGAAGNQTVTGIATGDELDEVIYYVGAGTAVTDVVDLTSEFRISAAATINNTDGTDSTGGKLIVRWTKLT